MIARRAAVVAYWVRLVAAGVATGIAIRVLMHWPHVAMMWHP